MNGLTIALYGLALLYVCTTIGTVARIGKPKSTVTTGGEAAYMVLFGAVFVTIFVIAAQAVAS